jgi:hypothetical protein
VLCAGDATSAAVSTGGTASSTSVGNYTATVQSHKPALRFTWEDAPACPFTATGESTASILFAVVNSGAIAACAGAHAAVLGSPAGMESNVNMLIVSVVHQCHTGKSRQHALLPHVGTHKS